MMKTFFQSLCLLIVAAACSLTAAAQTDTQQRLTREQLAEKQARHMARNLALEPKTADRFVHTYCEYQREVWALGPRIQRSDRDGMGAEKASQEALQQRFERSRKLLDLREKYYKTFSRFMTQQQIEQMYRLEKQNMRRLAKRKAVQQKGQGGPRQ